uniref:PABS domain-containing protein n=1 Tax=viral metagenome TaxID=1070528 RepID=A0A6C0KVM4_9ZZZZ
MSIYIEKRPELGMNIAWQDVTICDQITTERGTVVEMLHRPNWGVACYMDNQIQSCESDEQIYHEALVHPGMACLFSRKRVMIIGGGEGATLREVVKWDDVEQIDMYEWDKEVTDLFKNKYPQWAKGAWDDSRVTLHHDDIFKVVIEYPKKKYDVIIIDLFDPSQENEKDWKTLFEHLSHWLQIGGVVSMYAGIRSANQESLIRILKASALYPAHDLHSAYPIYHSEIVPYRVYIPSFSGESVFILVKSRACTIFSDKLKAVSHITKDVWKSYKTFNSLIL